MFQPYKKSDVAPEKLDICVHYILYSLPKNCILMAFCRTSRHLKHVHNVGGKCICTKTEKGEEKRPLITAIIIFQIDMSVAAESQPVVPLVPG